MHAITITANVGSIFEEYELLVPRWIAALIDRISEKEVSFVAIHFQEIGGKNLAEADDTKSAEAIANVSNLCNAIIGDMRLAHLTVNRRFFCLNNKSSDFTALGALYLAIPGIAQIYNFMEKNFGEILGADSQGELEIFQQIQKMRFPKECSSAKFTRKGYCWCRWLIDGQLFDFVNIHLFHDTSNVESTRKSPSVYADARATTLKFVLDKCTDDLTSTTHFFLFGDCNFRLDHRKFLNSFVAIAAVEEVIDANNVVLKDKTQHKMMAISDKSFKISEKNIINEFFAQPCAYRAFDESNTLIGSLNLNEHAVKFPPSYAYVEGHALDEARGDFCVAFNGYSSV